MTEYYQAVFEIEALANALLDRHGSNWRSAAKEAAEAYHFFRKKMLGALCAHDIGMSTDWLEQVGKNAELRLMFAERV